jgi:hypothetical protein
MLYLHPESYRLRDEFQTFLAENLKHELAVEKTHVTHVNDGFNFLGFQVRRYVHGKDRPSRSLTARFVPVCSGAKAALARRVTKAHALSKE